MASASTTPSEGRALLELGKKAVAALREGSAESLDALEEYVVGFAAWESTLRIDRAGNRQVSPKEGDIAKRIGNQHAQIMRLAEEMRSNVDESLKALRVKGKGIKAYIDQLPQRISTIKPKKG